MQDLSIVPFVSHASFVDVEGRKYKWKGLAPGSALQASHKQRSNPHLLDTDIFGSCVLRKIDTRSLLLGSKSRVAYTLRFVVLATPAIQVPDRREILQLRRYLYPRLLRILSHSRQR